MNKIIASTGMVALSAAGLQAAYAPGLSAQDTTKSWDLNAGVQGFYDSNSTASPDATRQGSWGVGFDVGAGYHMPLDQTFLGVDFNYGLKWYEARDDGNTDQSFRFGLNLDHAFNERYSVSVKDSFVISSEPTVLDQGGVVTAPTTLRTDGDNMRNLGNIDFTLQFSPKWGATIGYENSWYDYKQDAGDVPSVIVPGVGAVSTSASNAQLLNRMQQLIPIDLRYTVSPTLVALVGYQFGNNDYLDDDPYLSNNSAFPPGTVLAPDWRNYNTQFFYGGAEYAVNSQLNTSLKAGAQFTKYTNLDTYGPNLDDSGTSPYVEASVSYLYNPGSYVTGGYTYALSTTDVQVLDSKTQLFYVALTHRITERVDFNLLYQFQFSKFNQQGAGGGFAGQSENFNVLGVDFDYKLTQHLSAQVGYKYDDLDSDIQTRSYNRHIGFLGIRASY